MDTVTIVFRVEYGVRSVEALFEEPEDADKHIAFEDEAHPTHIYFKQTFPVNKHRMTSAEYLATYGDDDLEDT